MADFGKLNFQVAFNPTTAFPLDARCYFEGDNALSAAQAAAATAEDVGSKNTVYHYGMKILVNQNGNYTWYKITANKTLEVEGSGGGGSVTVDGQLSTTSVNPVQNKVITEKINDIATTVGNIDILLGTI